MLKSSFTFGDESLPLLATAIHHGHELPSELLAACGISEADRLREEDPQTGLIAALFPNHIIVHSSRFAIDLNRSPDKAVYLKPEDCWGLPVRSVPVPEPLLESLRGDYTAWYGLLEYQLERLLQKHPFLMVLDLHSFNHRRGGPQAPPDPQEQNPDIIIGRSNLQDKHYPAAQRLCDLMNGQEYLGRPLDCRQDVKFTGGNFPRWLNAHYPDRVLCLAIEFKKTFMDEWTGIVDWQAFSALKQLFRQAVDRWLEQPLP